MGRKAKRKRITLGEAMEDVHCTLCSLSLVTAMARGIGITRMPDGNYYCRECGQLIRRTAYGLE
jgi:RNase P subunit RPR2